MKFKNLILFLFAITIAYPLACEAQSTDPLANLFSDEPEFLPVDEAFKFDFSQRDDQLTIKFTIADGYYLYQNQFKTVTKNAQIGEPIFPQAKIKEDEFFDEPQPVFYHQVDFQYPIIQSINDGVVKLQFQGCADAGLCYPPTTKVVYLTAVGNGQSDTTPADNTGTTNSSEGTSNQSEQFVLAEMLTNSDNLPLALLAFIGFGILLGFTPCVFPMYPILSSIVIGQGTQSSTTRALILSLVYVQGMAITYSILGLIVASVGAQAQAALQHPAILLPLIGLFILLALVMFGAYELQLPAKWQEKLNNMSNKQKGGNLVGVFVMGVISGLVASPCTTAPLTAILLVIAQSGDQLLGFSALYALSIGMGIPLIVFGVTGGKLLPKAGNWMNVIKAFFGFMMLAVAISFIERMVTNMWTELAWAFLGLSTFSYFYVMNADTQTSLSKGIRTAIIFVGLFASVNYGYQHIFNTEHNTVNNQSSVTHPKFIVVKDLADFDAKLARANAEGKTVMVDLYADWCVACKEFEKYTFPDANVVKALSNTVWMQIDLTDNTPTNIEFQEHFAVLGLPTILFFDEKGNELSSARVTGFMRAEPFAKHVSGIF